MGTIPKGTEYIKTVPFFLKIAEFVILLVALVTLGRFIDVANPSESRLDFGMFAIVVSWIVVIVMVVVFVVGLHEKITVINWPMTVFINMVIWAVMLFIAGCVIADNVREYEDKKICDLLKYFNSDARCWHLIAATVCCFIASILFAVDAFFNFRILRGQCDTSSAKTSTPAMTST
ncbi:proteolipid protein 2-like isoform X1 [Xenia sp. Carnegie-2017]|uniref:proteolipid protein 2-like isoform X1 n=1 Tax=Xenia sp. Carnegie-2017 TaxID=2897299 RepID=UPI001F04EE6B|nr:proteolipid protein 2-like isoform X1 [Xenia sp. Carnegie-2017]XP_046842506.1 proteolipid protein 2-like isoform X1 [Xenia sp. Carnegie-2017]